MTSPLTSAIAAIRARLSAATPGPFHLTIGEDGDYVYQAEIGIPDRIIAAFNYDGQQFENWRNNIQLYSNSYQDLRRLCDAIEEQSRVLELIETIPSMPDEVEYAIEFVREQAREARAKAEAIFGEGV